MNTEKENFLQKISILWLTIGSVALCLIILLAVIIIVRPHIQNNKGNTVSTAYAQAKTVPGVSEKYSSDTSTLYPF
jgi:uncharacterized protein (UPF0333 family)